MFEPRNSNYFAFAFVLRSLLQISVHSFYLEEAAKVASVNVEIDDAQKKE
jgi:hypothetical protein